MRQKLNENPLAQVGLLAVLLVVSIVMLTKMGGGGEGGSEPEAESPAAAASSPGIAPAPEAEATASSASVAVAPSAPPADLPPTPKDVLTAFDSGRTVVLLIVREGGIDDRMVKADADALAAIPAVSLFVVPAQEIARYASLTAGLGVNRVPALVVLRPKALTGGTPTGSVSYGYQPSESVVQAVVDARYKGHTLPYHP